MQHTSQHTLLELARSKTQKTSKLFTTSCETPGVISEALAHQQCSKRTIASLLNAAELGPLNQAALISTLKKAEADVLGLEKMFSDKLDHTFYTAILPPGVEPNSVKVLGIPELLEECLDFLDVTDLLRSEQTCKAMRDATAMRLALGTMGRKVGGHHPIDIYFCDKMNDEYLDDGKAYRWQKDSNPSMQARIRGPPCLLPLMGERARARLICHPPVKMMTASTECCGESENGGEGTILDLVENHHGLTLGDLYDEAETWIRGHFDCCCEDEEVVVRFRSLTDSDRDLLRQYPEGVVCVKELAEFRDCSFRQLAQRTRTQRSDSEDKKPLRIYRCV